MAYISGLIQFPGSEHSLPALPGLEYPDPGGSGLKVPVLGAQLDLVTRTVPSCLLEPWRMQMARVGQDNGLCGDCCVSSQSFSVYGLKNMAQIYLWPFAPEGSLVWCICSFISSDI